MGFLSRKVPGKPITSAKKDSSSTSAPTSFTAASKIKSASSIWDDDEFVPLDAEDMVLVRSVKKPTVAASKDTKPISRGHANFSNSVLPSPATSLSTIIPEIEPPLVEEVPVKLDRHTYKIAGIDVNFPFSAYKNQLDMMEKVLKSIFMIRSSWL